MRAKEQHFITVCMMLYITVIDVGTGGVQMTRGPHFSQIIRQSAPLQLKKMPIFVHKGAPEYMYPLPLLECFLRP